MIRCQGPKIMELLSMEVARRAKRYHRHETAQLEMIDAFPEALIGGRML